MTSAPCHPNGWKVPNMTNSIFQVRTWNLWHKVPSHFTSKLFKWKFTTSWQGEKDKLCLYTLKAHQIIRKWNQVISGKITKPAKKSEKKDMGIEDFILKWFPPLFSSDGKREKARKETYCLSSFDLPERETEVGFGWVREKSNRCHGIRFWVLQERRGRHGGSKKICCHLLLLLLLQLKQRRAKDAAHTHRYMYIYVCSDPTGLTRFIRTGRTAKLSDIPMFLPLTNGKLYSFLI